MLSTAIFAFYPYWRRGPLLPLLKRTHLLQKECCHRSPYLCLSSPPDLSVIDNYYHIMVYSISLALWLAFLFCLGRLRLLLPPRIIISQALSCSQGSVTEGLGWGSQLADMSVWAICVSSRQPGSREKKKVAFKKVYTQLKVCVGKAHLRPCSCDC